MSEKGGADAVEIDSEREYGFAKGEGMDFGFVEVLHWSFELLVFETCKQK